ncbi:MAG TPA: zinc-dependent metalloprotease family protein [Acidimicrobiales bacterium]|nr:zinc-dependent metalloprotease family protein [Acidimicrobiales bacterium]
MRLSTRRLAGVMAAAVVAAAAVSPLAHGASATRIGEPVAEGMRLDTETDCDEWTPDSFSIGGITDEGDNIDLDVLVLLDGVGVAAATELMTKAARSYAPLDITLKAGFQSVSFAGNDAQSLINQAKAYVGGARPETVDVIHVLTAKPMTDPSTPPGATLAGLADCIGGVKDPRHAFSVARVDFEPPTDVVLQLDVDTAARVTAHEIGHLFGAHHHYANCVEGAASELNELSPCTLMFNATNFGSANFSQLNASMVRGHAVNYATP